MACDHGMMLMSDHDDAYVDGMLMVNMQANIRSVTPSGPTCRAPAQPPGRPPTYGGQSEYVTRIMLHRL